MKFYRSKALAKVIFTTFLTVGLIPYGFSEGKECGCSKWGGGMVSSTFSYWSADDGNCCTPTNGAASVESSYSFFWTTTLSVSYVSVADAQDAYCN